MKDKLWEEKYRPVKVDDLCLPETYKKFFTTIIQDKNIPHLLLWGYTGIGKTTSAKILALETQSEYIFINGSENRGIDVLRTDIKDFVSTMSLNSLPKLVIIDEADNLTKETLAALRGYIEEYQENARFIFTAETIEKFPKAILSRIKDIEFRFNETDSKDIKNQYLKRLVKILVSEKIKIEKVEVEIIKEFISMNFPGLRKTLVDIQKYILRNGKIDLGLIKNDVNLVFENLCMIMKRRDFTKMRELVKNEIGEDTFYYFKKLYENIEKLIDESSIGEGIITIGEFLFRDNSIRSKEINFAACCAFLMNSKIKWR